LCLDLEMAELVLASATTMARGTTAAKPRKAWRDIFSDAPGIFLDIPDRAAAQWRPFLGSS
jgi:hypothetical protein